MKGLISILALGMVFALTGCASSERGYHSRSPDVKQGGVKMQESEAKKALEAEGIEFVSASQLSEEMDSEKKPIVVDVLSPESYRRAHIPGAINLPVNELRTAAPSRLPDMDARIIVYCASYECHASTSAAKILEQMGYANVGDYKGGLKEWNELGYQLEEYGNRP